MEKKKYIAPSFEVIVLKQTSQLLAGSGTDFDFSDDPASEPGY